MTTQARKAREAGDSEQYRKVWLNPEFKRLWEGV